MNSYLQIAADMYDGDPGKLHISLIYELNAVANLNKGNLRSSQVIALLIYQWQKENPDLFPYEQEV